MNTDNLIAWLTFDTDCNDLLVFNWTQNGSPSIEDGRLILDGASYLQSNASIMLGGRDFTIAGKFSLSESAGKYATLLCFFNTTETGNDRIFFGRDTTNEKIYFQIFGSNTSKFAITYDTEYHFEMCYSHAEGKTRCFIDGVLRGTISKNVARTVFNFCWLGKSNYAAGANWTGTVDEFQIFDGVALHTEDFTPPTDDEYDAAKLTVNPVVNFDFTVDLERRVKNSATGWRYENVGLAERLAIIGNTLPNLTAEQSTTTVAFTQPTRTKCFDIPDSNELWLRFDVFNGTVWRACNDGDAGACGIRRDGKYLYLYHNDTRVDFSNVFTANTLQHVILYMKSGISDGLIIAWVDGKKIYTFTGNVNRGELFADVYLQADNSNAFFSDVVISNSLLTLDDHATDFSGNFTADLVRRVRNSPPEVSGCIVFDGTNYAELPLDILPGATEFTVEVKFSTTSTANFNQEHWAAICGREVWGGSYNDFALCVNDGKLCFWAQPSGKSALHIQTDTVVNDGQIHVAAVRSNADGSLDIFCDGELISRTENADVKVIDSRSLGIAWDLDSHVSKLAMNLYELRFWSSAREEIFGDVDGTEEDLSAWYLPDETGLRDYSANVREQPTFSQTVVHAEGSEVFYVDLERDVANDSYKWRYEDCATYFGTGLPINFHIPKTNELWARFDVYFDGENNWQAYGVGSSGNSGIASTTAKAVEFSSLDTVVATFADIAVTKKIQHFMLHMLSGTSDGVIEAWSGQDKFGTFTGNVNGGKPFSDFVVQSDADTTFFTEWILSNTSLEPEERATSELRNKKTREFISTTTTTNQIKLERGGNYPYEYVYYNIRNTVRRLVDTAEAEPVKKLWIKFDALNNGVNGWAAYNLDAELGKCGTLAHVDGSADLLANDSTADTLTNAATLGATETFIIHMESGESDGLLELWRDGVKLGSFNGNVNGGNEFTDVYLTSDGDVAIFSNCIVSTKPLTFDDNADDVRDTVPATALTLNVFHNGEIISLPFNYSDTPVKPAVAVRWLGLNWYSPLSSASADLSVRHGGNVFALERR